MQATAAMVGRVLGIVLAEVAKAVVPILVAAFLDAWKRAQEVRKERPGAEAFAATADLDRLIDERMRQRAAGRAPGNDGGAPARGADADPGPGGGG